jgi:hypothetical protein
MRLRNPETLVKIAHMKNHLAEAIPLQPALLLVPSFSADVPKADVTH